MSRKMTMSALFLCLLIVAPALGQTLNRCVPFFTKERVAFDLTSLDSSLKDGNYSVTLLPHKNPKTGNPVILSRIEFKACGIAKRPNGCPEIQGGAFAYYFADGVCLPQIVLSSVQDKEVIKVNEKVNGVSLAYNNNNLGEELKKATGPNLKFRVTCNKDNKDVAKWSFSTEGDYLVLSTEHIAGCGKALDDLLELVIMYKWIFLIVFVAIGAIFTFFGRHAYKWTLLLTGFILGFLMVAIVCYSFGLFHNSTDGTKYGILAASLLVGLLVGFILYKLETLTVMIVCGVLCSLIFMAIMSTFFANNNLDKLVLLLLVIVVGVIGGVLAGCYKDVMLIISSGLGGSFLIVISIGFATNTMETPSVIQAKAKAGESITVVYIYGAFWLLLGLAGIIFQFKMMDKKDGENGESAKPADPKAAHLI